MQSARIHPVARALAQACRQLHQAGLAPGLSGQFSVRDEDLLWLTPATVSFRDMQPEHLLIVSHDGQIIGAEAGATVSHLTLHQALYQSQPQTNAVLVAYPPFLSKWLTAQRPPADLPPEGIAVPVANGGTVQLVPSQTEASRLMVMARLYDESVRMEVGFGALIVGKSLSDARNRLEVLEATLALT